MDLSEVWIFLECCRSLLGSTSFLSRWAFLRTGSFSCCCFCCIVYVNEQLAHCTTPNLEDQGVSFSLAPTPQTWWARLNLPGAEAPAHTALGVTGALKPSYQRQGDTPSGRWPEVIPNGQLWDKTWQDPTKLRIRQREWRWIGHEPCTLYLGVVHPLQDVGVQQWSPLSSVGCSPYPGCAR